MLLISLLFCVGGIVLIILTGLIELFETVQPTLRVPVVKIDLPLPSAEVVATATYAAVAAVATTTLATPLFDKLKKQIQKFLQKKVDKWKENRQKKKKRDSSVS